MRPLPCALLAGALALAAGCGDTGRTLARPITAPLELVGLKEASPDWVRTPPRTPGLVYGIGQAALGDRDGALAQARQDLVSQLEVSIEADQERDATSTAQLASGPAGGTEARSERYQEASRSRVRARASADDLPGVTVVKQEDGSRSTWILISLDRRVWAEDLRSRIAGIDHLVERDLASIDRIPDTAVPQRLSIAGRLSAWILPRLAERDVQVGRLRLADPAAAPPAEPVDRGAITARLAGLLKDLTVELALAGDLKDLEGPAQQAFAKCGFRSLPTGGGATLQVPLALTFTHQAIGNQIRIDGHLGGTIRLAPVHGGATLAAVDLSDRAGAPTLEVARDRLMRKLAADLAKDLDDRLLRILAGDP